MPTIAADLLDDFSCSTFALRTIVASVSDVESAASFAARMDGVGEQPGTDQKIEGRSRRDSACDSSTRWERQIG
jgi:hypothetical protein